ncbi:hypothetical protein DX130_18155 [Paenibacillus paeoniae]|uniref:Uncharacterized protein n=1 Tax=Paenibacillus paeoniae TaxID=2292705 RepID=A0A371PFP7_9BACL|nr:hypothetical protein DX130_18155 [Paenibacillus paeoniae]
MLRDKKPINHGRRLHHELCAIGRMFHASSQGTKELPRQLLTYLRKYTFKAELYYEVTAKNEVMGNERVCGGITCENIDPFGLSSPDPGFCATIRLK